MIDPYHSLCVSASDTSREDVDDGAKGAFMSKAEEEVEDKKVLCRLIAMAAMMNDGEEKAERNGVLSFLVCVCLLIHPYTTHIILYT